MALARKFGCFVLFGNVSSTTKTLICGFPPAGGNPLGTFKSWENHIPSDVGILSYCLPGRGTRLKIAQHTTFDDVVKEVVTCLLDFFFTQPIEGVKSLIFYGHSLGALFAFHTCCYLEENPVLMEAIPVPIRLICAAKNAPINEGFRLPPSASSDEILGKWVQEMGGGMILQDPDFLGYFLTLLRADLALHEDYYLNLGVSYRHKKLTSITIRYYGGIDDGFSQESQEAWKSCTELDCSIRWWKGGHFFMDLEPKKFILDVLLN